MKKTTPTVTASEPLDAPDKTTQGTKFYNILTRTNKQIRSDRALAIARTAGLKYRRVVEDYEVLLEELQTDRDNLTDISPADRNTNIVVTDFDSSNFVDKHIELGIKIRQLEIKLEVARRGYNDLFGK